MYQSYFGLREKPFNATPDLRFFYTNRGYQEAYTTLLYGIRERKGFIALTGEVGTGKTTLLRRLMDNLNPGVKVVFLYNTTLTFDELVEFICAELNLSVSGPGRVGQLQALNTFLIEEARRGGSVILLLDEAQNLSIETLENLRLISDLETSTAKLLQIVLVGQPELEGKLADPALRQFTQQIAIQHRLKRLSDAEVETFIDHRLRLVGRQRRDLFTDEAIQKLTRYAGGIPRLINILCDNALLLAYIKDVRRVTGRMIDEVATNLGLSMRPVPPAAWPLPTPHTPEPRGRQQRTGVSSGTVASAGRRRWAWVGVACATATVGIAAAGLGRSADITRHLPSIGALADRTLKASGHLVFGWFGTTDVHWSQPPVPAPEPAPDLPLRAEGTRSTGAPAAARTSASLTVQRLDGQSQRPESETALPSAPETPMATGSPASGSALRSTGVSGIAARRLTIPRGGTLSEIAFAHYGGYSALALDLIHELNPAIRDIDVVAAGQSLWLPALDLETRLRRQPDGSFRLIVTSQPGFPAAEKVAEKIRRHGYAVTLRTREVASNNVLLRVEIVNLTSREAAVRAGETARRLGWFDLKRDDFNSR